MPYILEVQRFDSDGHLQHPEWNGKAEPNGMHAIIMIIIILICGR